MRKVLIAIALALLCAAVFSISHARYWASRSDGARRLSDFTEIQHCKRSEERAANAEERSEIREDCDQLAARFEKRWGQEP